VKDQDDQGQPESEKANDEALEWEVRVGKDGFIRMSPEFVGPFLADRMAWEADSRSARRSEPRAQPARAAPPHRVAAASGPEPISPDTFVDQRTGLLDKRMYLRLASEKAFPSRKVGKRIVARWGDVQAALAPATTTTAGSEDHDADPELDAIRAQVGLRVGGDR
jgi:hypothetical protein